jgi:hypothetical protein
MESAIGKVSGASSDDRPGREPSGAHLLRRAFTGLPAGSDTTAANT